MTAKATEGRVSVACVGQSPPSSSPAPRNGALILLCALYYLVLFFCFILLYFFVLTQALTRLPEPIHIVVDSP